MGLEKIDKRWEGGMGHPACVARVLQRARRVYTLECRKSSADGYSANFVSRLPQLATERDRSESSRLAPVFFSLLSPNYENNELSINPKVET